MTPRAIYLGICAAGEQDAGHQAAAALMRGNLGMAIAVSIVHAAAMIVSGGIVALAVHEWLGYLDGANFVANFEEVEMSFGGVRLGSLRRS